MTASRDDDNSDNLSAKLDKVSNTHQALLFFWETIILLAVRLMLPCFKKETKINY